MIKKIILSIYIFLIILIISITYYSITSFAYRYRIQAAKAYLNDYKKNNIDKNFYEKLLITLHIPKKNAPPFPEDNYKIQNNFFDEYSQHYIHRGNAANFDTIVSYINKSTYWLFITFIINTFPFAVIAIFTGLIAGILIEYFGICKPLALAIQILESIPIILIILYFHSFFQSLAGWYMGISIVMIPACYRPVVGMIKELKYKNIIDGERMYSDSEWYIILKLCLYSWPLLLSSFFFFMAMALMLDSCMNYIAAFDFGVPTISSCLGRIMDIIDQDLGLLNQLVITMRNEILMLATGCIFIFILSQKFILRISDYEQG